MSKRLRDRLTTPLETAVHWVKYVAKYKGAPHLRSAAVDIPFYAMYNHDAWIGIIIAFVINVKIIIWLVNCCIRWRMGVSARAADAATAAEFAADVRAAAAEEQYRNINAINDLDQMIEMIRQQQRIQYIRPNNARRRRR